MVITKAPRLYRKNIGVQITNVDEFIAKADSGVDKMCKGVAFRMAEANQERSYSERRASSPSTTREGSGEIGMIGVILFCCYG